MIDRIEGMLRLFFKESPEELSVCEACPKTKCTINEWAECELLGQAMLHGNGVTQYNTFAVQKEVVPEQQTLPM